MGGLHFDFERGQQVTTAALCAVSVAHRAVSAVTALVRTALATLEVRIEQDWRFAVGAIQHGGADFCFVSQVHH